MIPSVFSASLKNLNNTANTNHEKGRLGYPGRLFFIYKGGPMTKAQKSGYEDSKILKTILKNYLTGRKFRLDCGHHVTFGYFLGNDITIYNGKKLTITCAQCGY